MADLAGQRTQFTWALNQYNLSDDPDKRAHFARRMAKYISNAPSYGFSVEQVTQGQSYPADEVAKYLGEPTPVIEGEVSDDQAKSALAQAVDTANAKRRGAGLGSVYAYGYACSPDRLKIGYTDRDTIERIAAQIGTSTPDKPVLYLEIRSNSAQKLERAIQSILTYRGQKILGGGDEWFKTSVNEVEALCDFLDNPENSQHKIAAPTP